MINAHNKIVLKNDKLNCSDFEISFHELLQVSWGKSFIEGIIQIQVIQTFYIYIGKL